MDQNITTTPDRILIVRLSAIGDVVHGLPVASALRQQFPHCRIGWIVEGRTAELLDQHPCVDQVLKLPRGWYRSWSGIRAARQAVKTFAPQVTLDLQGLTKSAALAWCSGAKLRIGFAGVDGRELSPWLNNHRVHATATHVVDKNLELLQPLGIYRGQPIQFGLSVQEKYQQQLQKQLQVAGLTGEFALINPGAGWASKRWPVGRWAMVAEQLFVRCGLRSVVAWAPGDERAWAEQIIQQAPQAAILAPPTNLCELIELARLAKLFLSGDTGPLHLAAAVGTPCVALFGASDAQRNGPCGGQHCALQKIKLTGSSRTRRTATNAAMCAITVEDVVQVAMQQLSEMHQVAAA